MIYFLAFLDADLQAGAHLYILCILRTRLDALLVVHGTEFVGLE